MLVILDFDIPWHNVDGQWYGFVIEAVSLFYCFVGLAICCDEYMVPALETLCHRWGIGEDVAGATFMAFGSAAPEMIINVVATIQAMTNPASAATTSLGVSAILGSGMIAFSLIPAACGLFAGKDLMLKRRPLFRDEFFYMASLLTLTYIIHDGLVHAWECALLVIVYCSYLVVIISATKVRKWYLENVLNVAWEDRHALKDGYSSYKPLEDEEHGTPDKLYDDGENREETFKKPKDWKDQLTKGGFQEFVSPFEDEDWDNPELWGDISKDDFASMGIRKGGTIAKFKQFWREKIVEHDENLLETASGSGAIERKHSMMSEESTGITKVFELVCYPMVFLFELTCPDCELGHKYEHLYMVTFLVALVWVSIMSFILSSVVERWVSLSGVPMVFFGLILVSLGAEIPDTIASVSCARKGFGSLAVANCQGTQVINICLGLGAPWLVSICWNGRIELTPTLVVPAMILICLVCGNMFLLLGVALCSGANKVTLNKTKSYVLILGYVASIAAFGGYLHSQGTI